MSESRQQRRARERAAVKAATRPRPRPLRTPAAAAQQQTVEVELNRTVSDGDPTGTYVSWHAEWGLPGSNSATEDSRDDLAELVAAVLRNVQGMTDRCTVRLEWTIGGDAPEGSTIEAEIAELGVELPGQVTT